MGKQKPSADEQSITVEQWGLTFTRQIVKEVFALVSKEETQHGPAFAEGVEMTLLASCVSTCIYRHLLRVSNEPQPEGETFDVWRALQGVKMGIQEAVADGVSAAVRSFSANEMEFVCTIKPVPEPTNIPC